MPTTYDVFISYAREDLERVKPWFQELKDGRVSAFFDMESLLGGGKWQGEIVEAIDSAKLVILFVSRSSMASEFVPKELALAVEMKKNILPVFLEETEVRGQMAFCIAGLHRVQVHDSKTTVRQHLLTMQPKLREFGVDWVNPTQFLNGVRQASRRVADDVAGQTNVRKTREPEVEHPPVHDLDEDEEPHGTSWAKTWLVLMILAGTVIAFYWLDVGAWLSSKDQNQTLAETNVPKALQLTLEDEARDLAADYYLAAKEDPLRQIALLADKLEYLGHSDWRPADVQADLATYAKKWTHQQFDVLEKPRAHVIEPGKLVECDVPLRYTSKNAIITSTATFTGRLRMQRFGNDLKITSVTEVPDTRKSEPLKFDQEVQKKKALEHVAKALISGDSASQMTPETVAAMYEEESNHLGN